jgi:hypothetical protein
MVIGTDCILNTTYMVLMKNVRDISQVATLGRQLFPGCSKVSTVCYTDALSDGPYSYPTNKTDCHNITEILLKVTLNTINLNLNLYKHLICMPCRTDHILT